MVFGFMMWLCLTRFLRVGEAKETHFLPGPAWVSEASAILEVPDKLRKFSVREFRSAAAGTLSFYRHRV